VSASHVGASLTHERADETRPRRLGVYAGGEGHSKLWEVVQGLEALLDGHKSRPEIMTNEVSAVISAARDHMAAALADVGVYHDPRWAALDEEALSCPR
jgi:hypothetical protein